MSAAAATVQREPPRRWQPAWPLAPSCSSWRGASRAARLVKAAESAPLAGVSRHSDSRAAPWAPQPCKMSEASVAAPFFLAAAAETVPIDGAHEALQSTAVQNEQAVGRAALHCWVVPLPLDWPQAVERGACDVPKQMDRHCRCQSRLASATSECPPWKREPGSDELRPSQAQLKRALAPCHRLLAGRAYHAVRAECDWEAERPTCCPATNHRAQATSPL